MKIITTQFLNGLLKNRKINNKLLISSKEPIYRLKARNSLIM